MGSMERTSSTAETLSADIVPRRGTQAAWLLLLGLGIGWLVGLSISPVVGGVIASLLSIAAGVLVTVPAITGGKRTYPDAQPVALLVIGVALGASGGIVARTYALLEPRRAAQEIAGTTTTDSQARAGVLFRVPVEECSLLRAHWSRGEKDLFVGEFRNSTLPKARELASRVEDPAILNLVVEAICGS
jgi:MFS family permease